MTEPLSRLPTLSRRTLLAGAAAAGLTAGMPPVRAAGLRWDGEAEIVIVGSGGAGVSAALAARERTKGRIVILEKLGVTGGSTRFSCGYFNAVDPERQRAQGIEDSLERHIADTNASGPRARRPRTRQDPLLGGARRAPLGRGLRRQVRALLLADLRRPLSEKPPAEALRPAGELHRRAARRLQKPRHRDPDFKPRPLPRAQRGRFGRRSRMARRFGHEVYAQGFAGRRAGFGRVFGQRRALPPA